MKTKEIRFIISEFTDIFELNLDDQKLLEAARSVSKNAYAPYSRFCVGAAVELDNGEIITGSNQENAAFPSGLCAERVALFYANSRYPESAVKTIAVTAFNNGKPVLEAVAPCGSCRQVLAETESRYKNDIRVILDGEKNIVIVDNARSLLPLTFTPDFLK